MFMWGTHMSRLFQECRRNFHWHGKADEICGTAVTAMNGIDMKNQTYNRNTKIHSKDNEAVNAKFP